VKKAKVGILLALVLLFSTANLCAIAVPTTPPVVVVDPPVVVQPDPAPKHGCGDYRGYGHCGWGWGYQWFWFWFRC